LKKFQSLIYIALVFATGLTAQGDSLRISLLTYSPGVDLYTAFGHSAVRVQDLREGTDVLYNYGTFDFNTPNFYQKFLNSYTNWGCKAPIEYSSTSRNKATSG
jgi:hypothetical protein